MKRLESAYVFSTNDILWFLEANAFALGVGKPSGSFLAVVVGFFDVENKAENIVLMFVVERVVAINCVVVDGSSGSSVIAVVMFL